MVRLRVPSPVLIIVVLLISSACAGRARPRTPAAGPPPAGDRSGGGRLFTATAYCQGTITASGTRPSARTVAADPDVLPMGARIRVRGLESRFRRYNRDYVVEDTGGLIRGRRIDLYMRDCREAIAFGRRSVRVSVLRR